MALARAPCLMGGTGVVLLHAPREGGRTVRCAKTGPVFREGQGDGVRRRGLRGGEGGMVVPPQSTTASGPRLTRRWCLSTAPSQLTWSLTQCTPHPFTPPVPVHSFHLRNRAHASGSGGVFLSQKSGTDSAGGQPHGGGVPVRRGAGGGGGVDPTVHNIRRSHLHSSACQASRPLETQAPVRRARGPDVPWDGGGGTARR